MNESDESVTVWFDRLRDNNPDAARQLWRRYYQQLVDFARQRLGNRARKSIDEEDVALSVLDALCRGAERGQFPDIQNRDDLWRLLLAVTNRKIVDKVRYAARAKRGGGNVRTESVFQAKDSDEQQGIDLVSGHAPTPELLAEMNERLVELLDRLRDDKFRRIAVWKMEGYSNEEIAEKLAVATRTVERKLNIIRQDWTKAVQDGQK